MAFDPTTAKPIETVPEKPKGGFDPSTAAPSSSKIKSVPVLEHESFWEWIPRRLNSAGFSDDTVTSIVDQMKNMPGETVGDTDFYQEWLNPPPIETQKTRSGKFDPSTAKPVDDLPWDVPMTAAQMRKSQEQTHKADETVKAIGLTEPEPGLSHLLWSIVGGPLEIAVKGGQSALGERAQPTGAEAFEQAGLGITKPVVGGLQKVAQGITGKAAEMKAREEARQPWTPDQIGAAAQALGAPKIAKAERIVESKLNKTGPTTAQEALDKFNEARAAGDPLTLPDVFPQAEKLAGRMHRAPGGEAIGETLTARDKGAVGRLTENIKRDVGSDSAYQMFDDLKQSRSEAAKPLFDKAKAGGSIAPLETQLQSAFHEASTAEAEATRALQDARNQVTIASGKQTQTGGNVYSTSAANQQAREAAAGVSQAEHDLAVATKRKQDSLDMLQQAQQDRELNKPGAVWSPLIQEALADPDIRSGIKRGWEIERNEAFGKRPINATEYAITGYEADGVTPIVSKVPTFKLLQVAKEGLDAMLEGDQYRDKFTGALNKYGNSLKDKLTSYLAELDRLNPDYRPAREQWSGDTSNMRALKAGQTALKNKPEINSRLANDMTESERESAKLGLAQTLREVANDKGPLAAEFNTIAGTKYGAEGNRARIAPFFNNQAELDRFVKSIDREQTKARTSNKITAGSQTAERLATDTSPISPADMAHAGTSAALGHWPTLLRHGITMGQKLWDSRDPELNAQIARILGSTGARVERDAHGRITIKPPENPTP